MRPILDGNEDYWERGGAPEPPPIDVRYANLGIYGWDVRDCLSYTDGTAITRQAATPPHDDFLGAVPENDSEIAARSVLEPFGAGAAQIDAARWFGDNGGIDTLVIAHGSNNALRSVVDKGKPKWSGPGYDDLNVKGAYNVWRPTNSRPSMTCSSTRSTRSRRGGSCW